MSKIPHPQERIADREKIGNRQLDSLKAIHSLIFVVFFPLILLTTFFTMSYHIVNNGAIVVARIIAIVLGDVATTLTVQTVFIHI